MPIYKLSGKKDGLQQYRVRINYTDSYGKAKQIDRIAYGAAEAKDLELRLKHEYRENPTICRMTISELVKEYLKYKKMKCALPHGISPDGR